MSELQKIGGYDVHPMASMFALLDGQEFDDLVESIRTDGLKKKVLLDCSGQIVDGRNRIRACIKAGVAVNFERLPEGADIFRTICVENVFRRNLTAAQRAMVAGDLMNLGRGRPENGSEGVTGQQAADSLGVSRSSVSNAKRVSKKGTKELKDAVRDGVVGLKEAAQLADAPPEEQKQVVSQAASSKKSGKKRKKDQGAAAAGFSRDRWRSGAEVAISKLVARAPADMQDWAKGVMRDLTGGRLRREVQREDLVQSGDETELFDADDVISRIEGLVKEIPVTQRIEIKAKIGAHFCGTKPSQYLPEIDKTDSEVDRAGVVIAELKHRMVDQPAGVAEILKAAVTQIKRYLKTAAPAAADDQSTTGAADPE